MEYEIKELTVNSSDNIHSLYGKLYIPKGEIKGIFHVVHGMTEYIDRYSDFMIKLAKNGYLAFGYDNLGHGKTARDDSELGFIAHKDGWIHLVNDVFAFENAVKKLYPNLPLYLFGHSMGSFIVRLAAENKPEGIKKLIVCGTGGKNPLAPIGLVLAKTICRLKGEKYVSDFIINIAFGAYNKRFEGISKYDWLTKDRSIIDKYINDKYCTFKFTVSAMYDLVKLNQMSNRNDWFKNLDKNLPILLISGKDDPVGDYGKGVLWIYEKLKSAEISADLELYDNCRHEILNDSCKEDVIKKILGFIS